MTEPCSHEKRRDQCAGGRGGGGGSGCRGDEQQLGCDLPRAEGGSLGPECCLGRDRVDKYPVAGLGLGSGAAFQLMPAGMGGVGAQQGPSRPGRSCVGPRDSMRPPGGEAAHREWSEQRERWLKTGSRPSPALSKDPDPIRLEMTRPQDTEPVRKTERHIFLVTQWLGAGV